VEVVVDNRFIHNLRIAGGLTGFGEAPFSAASFGPRGDPDLKAGRHCAGDTVFCLGGREEAEVAAATVIHPFLMFQGRAEEAMNFYVSLFEDGRVLEIERYGADGPGKEGSVKLATFSIAGLKVMCIDSPVEHGFSFTPAISLFVTCSSEEQIDRLSATLSDDGNIFMPLGDYGFSKKFAWVSDRFGVAWQLNLE
jgi:predicted 3-demethylubiquinone-9 3-methyltransferase (glyoxalase superfamily)